MARVQQHGATPQRMPLADVLSNQGIDGQRTGTARPFPLWRLRAARIGRPSIQLLGSGLAPQARIAGRLTFQPPGRFRSSYGFHQHCPGVWRVCHIWAVSPQTISRICTCMTAVRAPLRTILAAVFGLLRPKVGGTWRGGADLYEAAAPGWKRGRLGSYRGALGLRWDDSAGYWIRRGVARPARSRRG